MHLLEPALVSSKLSLPIRPSSIMSITEARCACSQARKKHVKGSAGKTHTTAPNVQLENINPNTSPADVAPTV